VQNFNEQACILCLGALYSFSTGMGWSAFAAITAFGVLVAGFMALIALWHRYNQKHHPHELERLLEIARRDDLHG
jgi:MFS transporter, LPLT family, lysophospholipid transporter